MFLFQILIYHTFVIIIINCRDYHSDKYNIAVVVHSHKTSSNCDSVSTGVTSSRMDDHPGFIVTNPRHTYTCFEPNILIQQIGNDNGCRG